MLPLLGQFSFDSLLRLFSKIHRDTHREKAIVNETPALTKSMSMDVWVVCTFNQLFAKGC